jgi:hypothetical protein
MGRSGGNPFSQETQSRQQNGANILSAATFSASSEFHAEASVFLLVLFSTPTNASRPAIRPQAAAVERCAD